MPDTAAAVRPGHVGGNTLPLPEASQSIYLSDRQLSERFSVHRTTVWRWMREEGFPRPVHLSANCTRWRLSDVESWEAQRFAEAS